MGDPVTSSYAARPWVGLLAPVQREPVAPPPTVLHAFREAVARAPERTALAYFDGRIGYAEADALSDSVAGHLAARGVRRGDRVAVMLQNTPHFVLAVLAAWKAGAVVVPLNPMYKSGEVRHVLRDSGAAALVCDGRAWTAYLAEAARESAVRTVLTASDRDFQTRNDPRVFTPHPEPAAPAPQPGRTLSPQPASSPQPALHAQPGPSAQHGLPAQPGSLAQPGSSAQPGLASQPGPSIQCGSSAQPGLPAQPGSSAQPGLPAQPASSVQPGPSAQRVSSAQPGPHARPGLPAQRGPAAPGRPAAVPAPAPGGHTADLLSVSSVVQYVGHLREVRGQRGPAVVEVGGVVMARR
ncbi:AMP-binding protein, partial [Streptomyces sp. NPDC041003]|uniref:AMP-binding protein n=1 Tax=Streptomyces sp. NPDC041003 TaxID=3155730 RepID=UPI00340B90FB